MTNEEIIKDLNDIFDEFEANNWEDKLRCAALIGRIDTLEDLGILSPDEADKYQQKAINICSLTADELSKILFYGD